MLIAKKPAPIWKNWPGHRNQLIVPTYTTFATLILNALEKCRVIKAHSIFNSFNTLLPKCACYICGGLILIMNDFSIRNGVCHTLNLYARVFFIPSHNCTTKNLILGNAEYQTETTMPDSFWIQFFLKRLWEYIFQVWGELMPFKHVAGK